MITAVKRFMFRTLGMENYLYLLQKSYFIMYNAGLLKNNPEYTHHYFIKKLLRKGDVVLDIGANLGYYSIPFAKCVGSTGRVYSVEPIALYNKIFMKQARKYSNIELMPYALGLEEKEITLVSSPNVGYLRTGLPHVYDAKRDGDIEKQEFTFNAQMKIPSRLFASIPKIDYIKCDIEGFEYIVLSDMKDIINEHRPIVQVEVWPDNESELLDLFVGMDYIPYKLKNGKLIDVSKSHMKIEGDYIFIQASKDVGFLVLT